MTPEDTRAKRARADHQRSVDHQQAEDDMRWLMTDARGRRLVWGWLADAGLFRSTFTGDALRSAFVEGERNAGVRLHAQVMQHCPERFVQMLAEALPSGSAHIAAK